MASRMALSIMLLLTISAFSRTSAQETPLLVGGHAHGSQNIQILADLDVGNFVWIPKLKYSMGNKPWDLDPAGTNGIYADVDSAVANGLFFAVSQRRGLGEIWRPGGGEYGGDCWGGDLHSSAVVQEIRNRGGNLFAGLHAEELDADFLQSGLRPGFRSRIPHIYGFTDRSGGRAVFEGELDRIGDKYHGYGAGVKYWPNLCVSFHHSGFRAGGDLVIGELLESLPTTELQLGYLRGGGHQFTKDWGMWVSPWHAGTVPCEDKGLWPAEPAQIGGGHPASAFKRCLYLSYVSGARVLTLQETEPIFSRTNPENPAEGYKLAAWGTELKSFWDYVRNRPERLAPIVPLALLVDKDNGWQPGNLHGGWIDKESVWSKLPTDRADAMLSSYLDVLIPGYGRKEPGWWEKNIMYPGFFCETPIGAFDIVASDISAAKLSAYPNVMVIADVNMTPDLLSTLRTYVQGGGNLFVNVDQMRYQEDFVQDEELLGATIGGRIIYSSWAGGDITGRQIISAQRIVPVIPMPGVKSTEYLEPWFAMQDVQPGTAEVIANDGAGNPVLLRNHFGNGYAYLSTPEYMLQGWEGQNTVLGYFADLIRGLTRTGPVNVTAPSSDTAQQGISWIASRRGEGEVVVLLANHHESSAKQAEIHWREPCTVGTIQAGSGALLSTRKVGSDTIFTVSVPSKDVALLSIVNTAPPSTPAVDDKGPFTTSVSTLSASWSATSPDKPIVQFMYAIGTTPGGIEFFPWTDAQLSTSITRSDLSLSLGTKYYVSVKARNSADLWSQVGISHGITVVQATGTPGEVRDYPNTTFVGVSGVVTANASSITRGIFVESPDRSSATRVYQATGVPNPDVGSMVNVTGTLTENGGERMIGNTVLFIAGTAPEPLRPVCLTNKAAGGEALNAYTPGLTYAIGPYNIALLVQTTGRVLSVDALSKLFYIDDGSAVANGSNTGVAVSYAHATSTITPPTADRYVTVTGLSAIRNYGGIRYPLIRLRGQSDLVVNE